MLLKLKIYIYIFKCSSETHIKREIYNVFKPTSLYVFEYIPFP